jgi:hypothetical protein
MNNELGKEILILTEKIDRLERSRQQRIKETELLRKQARQVANSAKVWAACIHELDHISMTNSRFQSRQNLLKRLGRYDAEPFDLDLAECHF